MPLNLTGPDTAGLWEAQALAAGIRDGRVCGYTLDVADPGAVAIIRAKALGLHEGLTITDASFYRPLAAQDLPAGRLGNITLAYLYGFAYGQGQQPPAPRYRTLLQGKLAKLLEHHDSLAWLADDLGWSPSRLLTLLTGPDQPDAGEEAAIARALRNLAEVLMAKDS